MGIAVDDPLPAHPFARAPGKADKGRQQHRNDKHQREGMPGYGRMGSHGAIILAADSSGNASDNAMTVTWLHPEGSRYPRWNRIPAPAFSRCDR